MRMPPGIKGFKMALAVVLWLGLSAFMAGYDLIGFNLLTGIHVVHGALLLGFCHWAVTTRHDGDGSENEKTPSGDGRE